MARSFGLDRFFGFGFLLGCLAFFAGSVLLHWNVILLEQCI